MIEVEIRMGVVGGERLGCRGKGVLMDLNEGIEDVVCGERDFEIIGVVEEVVDDNGVLLLGVDDWVDERVM